MSQGLVNPLEIVESDVFIEACPKFPDAVEGVKVKPFVLDVPPEAFSEDVAERRPRSSMLMATPCASSIPVKAPEVNCTPGRC